MFSVFSADMRYNFNKINTLNQGTPYDYNSVMQYEKYGQPYVCVIHFIHCHVYFNCKEIVVIFRFLSFSLEVSKAIH